MLCQEMKHDFQLQIAALIRLRSAKGRGRK